MKIPTELLEDARKIQQLVKDSKKNPSSPGKYVVYVCGAAPRMADQIVELAEAEKEQAR